jgi:signal transduction histidine kinase
VLDAPARLDDVVAAARLGLEHERLQAERRAQLVELTAARKRIVAAAADERRRLERDLHDGAQQHLIAISIKLRLLAGDVDVDEARRELMAALEELRDLAHGLYPSSLAEEGLAAAIEGLAERSRVPMSIGVLPEDRLDETAEMIAYEVVAEIVASVDGLVRVSARRSGTELMLDVSAPDVVAALLEELGDRIGAVDGTLQHAADGRGRMQLSVGIPCGS